jgi:hypothetical protein
MQPRKNTKSGFLAIINAIAFTAMIIVNYIANALPINGKTTGAISDQYVNLFVPAGFTFAIWGVIYLSLLGFILYQISSPIEKRPASVHFIKEIHYLFGLNAIGNIGWILVWHYERLWVSVFIMVYILITLILIFYRLHRSHPVPSLKDKMFIWVPFSLYLGWISIATMANITTLLVSLDWSGGFLDPGTWSATLIVIGAFLSSFMLFKFRDPVFSLVVIWAFFGIYMKRRQDLSMPDGLIESVALLSIFCLSILLLIRIYQKKTYLY